MASFVERVLPLAIEAAQKDAIDKSWLMWLAGLPFAAVRHVASAEYAQFVSDYAYLNTFVAAVSVVAVFALFPPLLVVARPWRVYLAGIAIAMAQDALLSARAVLLFRCAGSTVGSSLLAIAICPLLASPQALVAVWSLTTAAVAGHMSHLAQSSGCAHASDILVLRVLWAVPLVLAIDGLSALCGAPIVRKVVELLAWVTWRVLLAPCLAVLNAICLHVLAPTSRLLVSVLTSLVEGLVAILRVVWHRIVVPAVKAVAAVVECTSRCLRVAATAAWWRVVVPTADAIAATARFVWRRMLVPVADAIAAAAAIVWRWVLLPIARALVAGVNVAWDWCVAPPYIFILAGVRALLAVVRAPPPPWVVAVQSALTRASTRAATTLASLCERLLHRMRRTLEAVSVGLVRCIRVVWRRLMMPCMQRVARSVALLLPIGLPYGLVCSATSFAREALRSGPPIAWFPFILAAYTCAASANLLLARAVAHELPLQSTFAARLLLPWRTHARTWERLAGVWLRHLDFGAVSATRLAATSAMRTSVRVARVGWHVGRQSASAVAAVVAALTRLLSQVVWEVVSWLMRGVLRPLLAAARHLASLVWRSPVLSLALNLTVLVVAFRVWRGDADAHVARAHDAAAASVLRMALHSAAARERAQAIGQSIWTSGGHAVVLAGANLARPLFNLAMQGSAGVACEGVLLLTNLLHDTPHVPDADAAGSLLFDSAPAGAAVARSAAIGRPMRGPAQRLHCQPSFAILVVLVHVISARRGVAAMRRTRGRVESTIAEAHAHIAAQIEVLDAPSPIGGAPAHAAPRHIELPRLPRLHRAALSWAAALLRGLAPDAAAEGAPEEGALPAPDHQRHTESLEARERRRAVLVRRQVTLREHGHTLHRTADEAERAVYAACCRAASKLVYGPLYVVMGVAATPGLRWLLAAPLIAPVLLCCFLSAACGVQLVALPLVLGLAMCFEAGPRERLATIAFSDWLSDHDAVEREMFASVQRLLEIGEREDASRSREAAASALYALLARPPPPGTPCFADVDDSASVCAICLDEYDGSGEGNATCGSASAVCANAPAGDTHQAATASVGQASSEQLALRCCRLGCGHDLHVRCTAELIRQSPFGARCPFCRRPLIHAGAWQRARTRRDVVGSFFA